MNQYCRKLYHCFDKHLSHFYSKMPEQNCFQMFFLLSIDVLLLMTNTQKMTCDLYRASPDLKLIFCLNQFSSHRNRKLLNAPHCPTPVEIYGFQLLPRSSSRHQPLLCTQSHNPQPRLPAQGHKLLPWL